MLESLGQKARGKHCGRECEKHDVDHCQHCASSKGPRLLVVGGADHKTGQGGDERKAMARLEQYVQERFHVDAIEQQWSAEFLEPADGLPYIGRLRTTRHVMTGAGYSGTG